MEGYTLPVANPEFDTLQAAESFRQAGMPADQAKAVARAIQQRGEDQAEDRVSNSGLAAALAQLETRLTNRLYISLGVLFAALVAVRFFT